MDDDARYERWLAQHVVLSAYPRCLCSVGSAACPWRVRALAELDAAKLPVEDTGR